MKAAVSAQNDDIDALVDPRFGRAAWFIVADSESNDWTALPNAENADASGGSGAHAAEQVLRQSVSAVVTGNVGPAAHRMLVAGGIRVFHGANGVTVREAVTRLGAHDLEPMDAPTVAGHWSRTVHVGGSEVDGEQR